MGEDTPTLEHPGGVRPGQAEDQSMYSELANLVAEATDFDSILSGAVKILLEAVGFERCTAALLDTEGVNYQLRTLLESRVGYSADVLDDIPLKRGISGRAIDAGETVVISSYTLGEEAWPPVDEAMEGGSIRTILSLPLSTGGRALGALTFGRSTDQPFTDKQIDLVRNFVALIAVAADRWRQAREFEERNVRHTLALYAVNERIWDWDLRSGKLYMSPQLKQMLGLPPEDGDVSATEWQARIHHEDLGRFRDGMRAYLRGETGNFREEFRVKDRTGEFRWVLQQGFGLRDVNARVYRMAGSIGDISERKKAEIELKAAKQRAEEANRTKDAFLTDLSHSLRIPLNSIIGYSEMLIEESEDLGEVGGNLAPDLEKIRTASRNLLDVVDTILDHFKIESGRVEVDLEIFDIEELIIDIATSVISLIEANGNRVEIVLDPNLGTMHSDPAKVRRMVFNLLSHTAKLARNTTINVSASRLYHPDGDTISISVDCNEVTTMHDARPVAPDSAPDSTSPQDYGGPGLGLTVSQYYCELLGGEISFNHDTAHGNIAAIKLPAAAE